MLQYKRVGLTVKTGLSYKNDAVLSILKILEDCGAEVFADDDRLKEIPEASDLKPYTSGKDIDLLMVIGGDGTILRSVRELDDFSVPIFSVNRGTVGFLAESELNEVETLLPELLQGGGVIEERSILRVYLERSGATVHEGFCLNEAVIAQGTIARLVELKTTVNKEELTVFSADGLIISTPTGSTAYSLAAGGPIVHPSLPATILTPINPHSFSQKPIVVSSTSDVEIQVVARPNKFQNTEVVLTLDGQVYLPLQSGDTVKACGCGNTVKFLRRSQDTFFSTLRQKLKWGE